MDDSLPVKTATCHTEGCENSGIPITLECADIVECGVCQQPITDIA